MNPLPFTYNAVITDTPTRVPFPLDLTTTGEASMQIRNIGADPLTSFTLKRKSHPNAIPVNVLMLSEDWTAGPLIVDIAGNPFALGVGQTCDMLINCKAQVELVFEATCASSTELLIQGYLFPDRRDA